MARYKENTAGPSIPSTSLRLTSSDLATMDHFRINFRLKHGRPLSRTGLVRNLVLILGDAKVAQFLNDVATESDIRDKLTAAVKTASEEARS